MKSKKKHWYIFYTKPKSEKVAYDSLIRNEFAVYLPLYGIWKTWKNRQRKLISLPLFPNYIFVRTTVDKIDTVLQEEKIVCCIRMEDRPAMLKDEEISIIEKMTLDFSSLTISSVLPVGEKVRVVNGPLAGYEGIVVKQKSKFRFGINIIELNRFASVEMDFDDLQLLDR
jgi:transcription antitermination factor NusG